MPHNILGSILNFGVPLPIGSLIYIELKRGQHLQSRWDKSVVLLGTLGRTCQQLGNYLL
jgi:hypothetical protein